MENTDEAAEEFQSPVRKSTRKKFQTVHYGHVSPPAAGPQTGSADEPQESDVSQHRPKAVENTDTNPESDESSDDSIPLSQYTPEKGKKRGARASKKLPSAKKARTTKTKSGTSFQNIPEKGSMFDIIKGGRVALQTVVDDWIENYNDDRTAAMVDLIQVIIQCCGCKGIVSEDMLEEEENVNAIRKLTEEFDEDTHEYPLTMSGPDYKKFKSNFCEFIDFLIEQCQHSILYDDFMMEKLISWLISLSDSQVRAFRHTSTLAGMKLVAALIQIALKVNLELDNTQRQLDSEKRKSASKRGVQKMEMLQNKKNLLRDNIRELEEFMNFIFQGIFVHRYRDIRSEIRSLCISEIGAWMKEYSTYFLSHKYLKYVVWTLHDKDGDVRFHALQSLRGLYEVEEFLAQLEPLTSRFKGRIVEMTLDSEPAVSVEAIKLVKLLFRYNELDDEDCQQVEQLVFCSHRLISHEAGAFLNERLSAEAESSSPTKKRASKKSEFQRKSEYFKKLIGFFVSSQIHNHASYLVDSLWQHCDYFKEWEVMTTMLLDDKVSEDLSDEEETALIELMACCCRQAATGQGPPGRFVKRLLNTKEKKTIVNDKQEMSGHFMVQLPVLLGKYGTDLPKAENLVTIAQYFDLEEYSQRRLGEHFEELLNQLDDLVQKKPETSLLEECASTYRVLIDNELTLKSKAEVARNKLIDSIVELFKEGHQNFNAEDMQREDGDEDENRYASDMEVNLRRITAFFKCHDLGAWDLYDILYDIARNMNGSDEICSNALVSMEMNIFWSYLGMKDKPPNKRAINILRQRVSSYVELCGSIIENEIGEIRKRAFLCISDTIVLFAKQLSNNNPTLSSLVYTASDVLQGTCTDFATRYAFSDLDATQEEKEDEDENTENEVEELNNKRVVLAGLCKLFAYDIFDMHQATMLFSRFISSFGNFGDLIKLTMSKCREININYYIKTVVLTLAQEFERIPETEDGTIDKTSETWIALKELARRLALTFGIELTKEPIRKAMINLHREAIQYGFSKAVRNENADQDVMLPNISFFDIINECSSRLIAQDKKAVLKILEEQMDKIKLDITKAGRDLQALTSYHKVLVDGIQGTPKMVKIKQAPPKARRKLSVDEARERTASRKDSSRRRSRKKQQDSFQEEEEEEEEEGRGKEPPTVEVSPVSGEQEQQQEKETPSPQQKETTKRKRAPLSEDMSTDEEANSEDDFQESSGVKAASQASWVASQPKQKRSNNHSKISYGKTADTSRVSAVSPIQEVEEEQHSEEDMEEGASPSESPKAKTPPRKRTKQDVPEDIFEESPALESQTDDDLPSGL